MNAVKAYVGCKHYLSLKKVIWKFGVMNQIKGMLSSKLLSDADYQRAADLLGVEVATIKAVVKIEAAGRGFLTDGRPKILFERHWFWKLTPKPVSKTRPDLSNPKAGGYQGGAREWDRLDEAIEFDRRAALQSASWGLGQIMGFNYKVAGYNDIETFVEAMHHSEGKQLDAMITFIKSHPRMALALHSHNWAAFAKAYNGPLYKRYQYDTKLAQAFNNYKTKTTEPVRVSNFSPKDSEENFGGLLITGRARIRFIKDSYLKRLPEQSSELVGDQKVPVIAGKEFGIKWFKKKGEHVLLALESPVAGVFNWYAYTQHIQINPSSVPIITAATFTPITPTTDSTDTQLSPNFKLWEFVVSETASRRGINNTPQQKHINRLRTLCEEILEPARQALGPLRINSGYRSPSLNRAVKGSKTSAHMQGYAADVNPLRVSKMEFAKWVKNNCEFDQIILEFGTPSEPAWIHVSCDPKRRKQVLKTVRGGYAVARL
jgi:hypothetical protein